MDRLQSNASKRSVSDHTVNCNGCVDEKSSERIPRISGGIEIDEEFDALEKKLKNRRGPVYIHYRQRYRQFWETDNKFKDWISAVKNNPNRAYCRYCQSKIQAHRSALLKHIKSLKHINSSPFNCSSPVGQLQTHSTPKRDTLHLAQDPTPLKYEQGTAATATASITSSPTKPVKVENHTVVIGSGCANNMFRQDVKDDEYDIFGKSVAMQLRRIHPTLRDDVMFNMNSQLYNALKAEIVYDLPAE